MTETPPIIQPIPALVRQKVTEYLALFLQNVLLFSKNIGRVHWRVKAKSLLELRMNLYLHGQIGNMHPIQIEKLLRYRSYIENTIDLSNIEHEDKIKVLHEHFGLTKATDEGAI